MAMGVESRSEKKLGSSIEDFDAHEVSFVSFPESSNPDLN
jgi:hypothetical protein